MNPIQIDKNTIHIKRDSILKGMNVPLDYYDPYVNSLIEEFSSKTLMLSNPLSSFLVIENPRFTDAHELILNEQVFKLGKIVNGALKKSSSLAFFICTAGHKIEKWSKELIAQGNSLEGLIVDIIGSEIAETITEITHTHIANEMAKLGTHTTNRYSPGYCNWPVSDQQKLFSLFKSNTCGIKLTASSLMQPIKSVSGIIGVGKDVKYLGYSCQKCDTVFCIYREKS